MAAVQREINTAPGRLPGRILHLEEVQPGVFWLDATRIGNQKTQGEIQLSARQMRVSAAILRGKADELDRAARYVEEWEAETRRLEAEAQILKAAQAADLADAETLALFPGHGEPTDEELCDMARWYAEREQGRFAIESDALDREARHA